MLIKPPAAANSVVSVKTIAGEEIVGLLVDQNALTLKLRRPATVVMQPLPNGQHGYGLMPVLATAEDDAVVFNQSGLLVGPTATKEEFRAVYIKATTGIEVAPGFNLAP